MGMNQIALNVGLAMPIQVDACIYAGILYGLAMSMRSGAVFVEIGTQKGVSTRMFLAATTLLMGRVHSVEVDGACEAPIRAALQTWRAPWVSDRWHFHSGRSQDVTPILSDFLFVDGDHSYEAVCSDLTRWGTVVRDGGLIVLDDCCDRFPGKRRWVEEREETLGVIRIGPFAIFRATSATRPHLSRQFTP